VSYLLIREVEPKGACVSSERISETRLPRAESPDYDCLAVSADGAWDFILEPNGGRSVPYVYLFERFELSRRVLGALPVAKVLDDYQQAVRSCLPGWQRVLAAGALSGNPFHFIQFWRVPAPLALAEALLTLRLHGGPPYRAFLASIVEFEHDILSPMPYDPGTRGIGPENPPSRDAILLVDKARVRPGSLARLACLKERFFIPRVTGGASEWFENAQGAPKLGWRLVVSATTVTSRPGILVQCWQLNEANALLRSMRVMSENETYREHVASCVEGEEHSLYEQLLSD